MDNKFLKNLVIALVSQGIAITMGLFTSFVIPKFIDIQNFANWQLFMLFNTYIALLHFGVNDGVYLTTAGKTYNEINKEQLGSQFRFISLVQVIITIIYLLLTPFLSIDIDTKHIIFGTLVFMILKNMTGYIGFIFQSVNETHIYSKSLIIEKIVFMILLVALLMTKVDSYKYFIWAFNFSSFVSLLYVSYLGREVIFSKSNSDESILSLTIQNAKIGASLMISAMASNFILGNVKFSINSFWSKEVFGRVSLAFSASSFVLIFIQQFSMVLFPSLKLKSSEDQEKFFNRINIIMNFSLPIFLIFYFPLSLVLGHWLPDYKEALIFLIYLLPVVLVDAKTQMIYITYMKILREERKLLFINVSFMVLGLLLSVLNGFTIKSLDVLFINFLIVMILRATFLENFINQRHYRKNKLELNIKFNSMLVLFIIISKVFGTFTGFVLYIVLLCIHIYINRLYLADLLNMFRNIKKGRR